MTRRKFDRTVEEVKDALGYFGLLVSCPIRTGEAEDCWGFWSPSLGVIVDPRLRGVALWRVLLHEIGHSFGLDHAPEGLMRSRPLQGRVIMDEPSAALKKRLVVELARSVQRDRERKWLV